MGSPRRGTSLPKKSRNLRPSAAAAGKPRRLRPLAPPPPRVVPTPTLPHPTLSLAYLGDAVYELYVRGQEATLPQAPHLYRQAVVARVRAEAQALCLEALLAGAHLTAPERDIVRRARNAAGKPARRLDPEIYQKATGFEALLGYLYLSDPVRLQAVLAWSHPPVSP
ncbi:MAG: ribonuclease III [Oscillatoriales cyanobacterium SM2_1_8]|nr:ribonuclease III [Oscillatoriales cyanobacterium SM2_1_8]